MHNERSNNCKMIAEEVAYSAKGHFKTADWLKVATTCLIIVPLITSLVAFVFHMEDWLSRLLGFVGLVFSSLALYSSLTNNPQKTDRAMKEHMALGNEYLSVYKEVRGKCVSDGVVSDEQLAAWNSKVAELDQRSSALPISWVGYTLTRIKIQREMDLKWLR